MLVSASCLSCVRWKKGKKGGREGVSERRSRESVILHLVDLNEGGELGAVVALAGVVAAEAPVQ